MAKIGMMVSLLSTMRFLSIKLQKTLTHRVIFLVYKNNEDSNTTSIWFIRMLVGRGCKLPFLIKVSLLQQEECYIGM